LEIALGESLLWGSNMHARSMPEAVSVQKKMQQCLIGGFVSRIFTSQDLCNTSRWICFWNSLEKPLAISGY
jgi:hypothetical protein